MLPFSIIFGYSSIIDEINGVGIVRYGIPAEVNAATTLTQEVAHICNDIGGCGLAGGKWEMIEPLIIDNLTSRGVSVYVYDFI